jgi:hypothetical protein
MPDAWRDSLWAILTWPGWWLLVVVMEVVLGILYLRIDRTLRRK